MKSIKVCFPSVKVFHSLSSNFDGSDGHNYLYNIEGVGLHLRLSTPNTSQLHRKWLGSGDHSSLDGSVHGIVWNIGLATVSRLPALEAPVRLLALHEVKMDLLADQWPPTLSVAPRMFPGDPNGPFVACEISVVKFHITERVEELRTSIDSAMPMRRAPSKSIPTTWTKFPRLELLIECNDIRACLITSEVGSTHATSMLVLQSVGFRASSSATFIVGNRKTVKEPFPGHHHGDVYMDTKCHAFLHPTFVRVGLAIDSKEDPGYKWRESSGEPDPMFGIDGVELSMTFNTPGYLESSDAVALEPYDSVLDIRCILDDVSIEFWKEETITATLTFVDAIRLPSDIKQATPPLSILDGICPGLSAHFGIGCLTCVVTGCDINPHCGLELSRGLEVSTGISIQYCCMQTRHSQPLGARYFTYSRDRKQLDLPEDLIHAAVSYKESEPQDLSALFQCATWQSTCRNITSTRYEYGAQDGAKWDQVEDRFISIPRTTTMACLRRRRQAALMVGPSVQETCDISVNIPHIQSRLNLLNAYSVLLASHTLQQFAPHHDHRSDPHGMHETSNIRTRFRLRVANAHIFCDLPLHERMFIRGLSMSLEHSPDVFLKIDCSSITAWVSNPHVEGKWEELTRLYGANVNLIKSSPSVKVAISAEGLRIAIPYGYVLSGLILNINIVIKVLRHLHWMVSLGYYMPLEPPGVEAPKRLIEFDIFIRSTTLEAADSPFEAKLGLIWRTGFQAQKLRIERELAFEAKLHAIMASGDSQVQLDSAPPSDLRYRFTSKRTTSLADARTRLNMVHSNSWISSISNQKAEIGRKEDTILRQLRHATNTHGLHVPLPISVHTPEKAPPLFRAVVNGLSISLTTPRFPAGFKGFLSELGGIPLSTEYTLLLPMHLNCSLDAVMMSIRDYPLPLFNIPFQADGPSVEFVTDLVIAEEAGSTNSVEWFQCPVVPHDTGIVGASAFVFQVPKTIMPVKSYANPYVKFCTNSITEFTWGVSYNPAIQEVMRVVSIMIFWAFTKSYFTIRIPDRNVVSPYP